MAEEVKVREEKKNASKSATKDMTVGSPMRLILGFSIPLLCGALFQQFYSVVDTVIVGRILGVNALAGVGATGSVNFMIVGFCMGVCSGFFHIYDSKGEEAVKNSPYYTEGNLKMAKRMAELKEKYNATITQIVLGFFTVQDFPCVPLYGAQSADTLAEAAGTFEISFDKEDYIF